MAMKVRIDEKNKILIIEIPINSPAVPSSTGKTLLVASTTGAKATDVVVNDQELIVNVNAYIYKEAKGGKKDKKEKEAA